MSLLAIPFLMTSLTYLVLGLWVITMHKNNVQRLYGLLCLSTCVWQGLWVALFSHGNEHIFQMAIKVGYTSIVFTPAIFYHFMVEYSQAPSDVSWIKPAYFVSFLFALLVWANKIFLNGFFHYTWGISAHAGALHPIFIIFVTAVILRMLRLLVLARRTAESKRSKVNQLSWIFSALVVYSCGAIDLLSNYGIPVFPLSCLFTGIAFVFFTYAIFRYDVLSIAAQSEDENERVRRIEASNEMKRLNMSTAFPLVSQGELLGYLLLGEKMSEEPYSREDLLLLRIIANQAALAYQRVRYLEMAVRGARTEMLGEIAGGFAHEIKTPLANISLPAELCFIDLSDVEQGKRKLEDVLPELKQRMKDIMQQTFKASDKIEAIRQFSKPGQVQLEQVEVTKVLQGSLSLLDHILKKMGINMKVELPASIAPIRGNAKQLEIVFVNLIKNAAEAMLAAGESSMRNLWLRGREESNWVVISVKDSGPGIKKTDIGHLFEAYFTTKGSTGTGMGLFLSHQVIKAHGGSIEVESEEGKGTEFIVKLPKYTAESPGIHEAA
jgi:signal transduction histidine kinase